MGRKKKRERFKDPQDHCSSPSVLWYTDSDSGYCPDKKCFPVRMPPAEFRLLSFTWFRGTLLIFRNLGIPVKRKATDFSFMLFHPTGLPRNLVWLLILVEWAFWVWKEPILDFSKTISQLKLIKRYIAQGHLGHWGICWIFLDLSMLPAVIWVTWTKRLLRHKAGAKWTLWMYFHYFLCICWKWHTFPREANLPVAKEVI